MVYSWRTGLVTDHKDMIIISQGPPMEIALLSRCFQRVRDYYTRSKLFPWNNFSLWWMLRWRSAANIWKYLWQKEPMTQCMKNRKPAACSIVSNALLKYMLIHDNTCLIWLVHECLLNLFLWNTLFWGLITEATEITILHSCFKILCSACMDFKGSVLICTRLLVTQSF